MNQNLFTLFPRALITFKYVFEYYNIYNVKSTLNFLFLSFLHMQLDIASHIKYIFRSAVKKLRLSTIIYFKVKYRFTG